MNIILPMILWTWGLTPYWVNLTASILCTIGLAVKLINATLEVMK